MSSTTTTKTSRQFDPAGLGTYQAFQPAFRNALLEDTSDPFKSMFFNTQLAMGSRANQVTNQAANQNLLRNAEQLGYSGNQPLLGSLLARQQRAFQGGQGQLFQNLLLQAAQRRQAALGMMGGFNPLETGQKTTQKKSGLGTWLSPLLGAGLTLATGGFGAPVAAAAAGTATGSGLGQSSYWNRGE